MMFEGTRVEISKEQYISVSKCFELQQDALITIVINSVPTKYQAVQIEDCPTNGYINTRTCETTGFSNKYYATLRLLEPPCKPL
jgi:hypothetical protein